jgi:hypothetical protein
MSHKELQSLLTQLHDTFSGNAPSAAVGALMQKMQQSLQNGKVEPEIADSASDLLVEVEGAHPKATQLVLDIIEILDRMGV